MSGPIAQIARPLEFLDLLLEVDVLHPVRHLVLEIAEPEVVGRDRSHRTSSE